MLPDALSDLARMSTVTALLIFAGSLLLSLMASAVLTERLDQVGERFRFPAGLLGLVTALGADSPEIASAITALIGGQHDLGQGVIFGSNIFNVAFLLGFSALAVGRVAIGRANLALNGGVALGVTTVTGAQAAALIGWRLTGLLLALLLLPYFTICCMQPEQLARLPLPAPARRWLVTASRSEHHDEAAMEAEDEADASSGRTMTWADGLSLLPTLAVIIVTSIAMVKTTTLLGQRWHVPDVVIGTFVVATLTGLPNLIASVTLAAKNRGTALTSEAYNSNTFNLLVGIYIPTLLVAQPPPSYAALTSVTWLIGITIGSLVLGILRRGFDRVTGALLLLSYAGFVIFVVR